MKKSVWVVWIVIIYVMDVCPNVKIGDNTITINQNKKAVVNPASCGSCEICIRACPYGAIEIIDEKIIL